MTRTPLKKRDGMTLVEVLIVVAIVGIVITPTAYFISQAITYFNGTRIRSQLLMEANTCNHTIRKFMQLGSAKTLVIDTPVGAPPYSHASFKSSSTFYDIRWNNGTVTMVPGGVMATNVQDLSFVVPDPAVPTQVLITLRLEARIDSKHRAKAQLNNQLVEMLP